MKTLNKNNPNVVKLYEVLNSKNNIYIVSEYCNGGDLKEYLQAKGKLPEKEAVDVVK